MSNDLDLLFGLEIEVGKSVGKKIGVVDISIPIDYMQTQISDFWKCKYDSTSGFELCTKEPYKEFPFQEVKDLCKILIGRFCSAHKTCGIHFHFSGIHLSNEQIYKLGRRMKRIGSPNKERYEYCGVTHGQAVDKNFLIGCIKGRSKYLPVRVVNGQTNHYECRVFNGTLNHLAIGHMFRQLKKEIGRIHSENVV